MYNAYDWDFQHFQDRPLFSWAKVKKIRKQRTHASFVIQVLGNLRTYANSCKFKLHLLLSVSHVCIFIKSFLCSPNNKWLNIWIFEVLNTNIYFIVWWFDYYPRFLLCIISYRCSMRKSWMYPWFCSTRCWNMCWELTESSDNHRYNISKSILVVAMIFKIQS